VLSLELLPPIQWDGRQCEKKLKEKRAWTFLQTSSSYAGNPPGSTLEKIDGINRLKVLKDVFL
jgi:hypothetical protein